MFLINIEEMINQEFRREIIKDTLSDQNNIILKECLTNEI